MGEEMYNNPFLLIGMLFRQSLQNNNMGLQNLVGVETWANWKYRLRSQGYEAGKDFGFQ